MNNDLNNLLAMIISVWIIIRKFLLIKKVRQGILTSGRLERLGYCVKIEAQSKPNWMWVMKRQKKEI